MTESIKIHKILGIDNTSDKIRTALKGGGIYVRELNNVDIDDENMPHRPEGYGNVILSGTGYHSIWSNGDICLFVHGNKFARLEKDFTTEATLINDVDRKDRITYVQVGDRVYFSNNSIVGYVNLKDQLPYTFPDPDQNFKAKMFGGHVLEYFNNRLYAGHDRIMYYSDATILTQMDTRKNAIPFPAKITMIKAVKDGLYVGIKESVGTGFQEPEVQGVYFLSGNDPGSFSMNRVVDTGPIDGMSIGVDGDDIGKGVLGKVAYWFAYNGLYKGYPQGLTVQMQNGLYFPDNTFASGTAILTYRNGYGQFLGIGQL